ncbi:type I-E CRISPR-associated endonuclease Cas1e [Bifidobacterium callimiconis]|uniref:CRISPR-associated endonuclease Cas1 n=1 Tax=Bifidobacterium callimiconis TaxID=2306973 RepID=A0A430FFP9_9BIFI|nr:type I-E CRISPR-associated endonuclease Cas1e [Bifidobacterium callimiconis]RSX51582.1 subtype I-E CRISPR-associated endonuclease Cas1 [Bifidobacterium callimiconis]
MTKIPGVKPPPLTSLVRVQDRLTFLYTEHCVVNRADNAVTITDSRGTVHVPAAALSVLMLGPGSNITYAAICLLAESRSTCIWVGERGVRYYCHGASLAQSTHLLEAQAKLVSSERTRVKIARRMYAMRFPNEKTDGLTMQQLLGKEGTRVRRAYERESKRTGVPWAGRSYKTTDFDNADEVNRALSAANTALYGVVHAVIVALGCSPGLGFIHARNERSFVYDIADLYKVDITVPLAFDLVAEQVPDVTVAARRGIRDRMKDGRFLQRCVRDVRSLLLTSEELEEVPLAVKDITTQLWSGASGYKAGGRNYSTEPDADDSNVVDIPIVSSGASDGAEIAVSVDDGEFDSFEDFGDATLREEYNGQSETDSGGSE